MFPKKLPGFVYKNLLSQNRNLKRTKLNNMILKSFDLVHRIAVSPHIVEMLLKSQPATYLHPHGSMLIHSNSQSFQQKEGSEQKLLLNPQRNPFHLSSHGLFLLSINLKFRRLKPQSTLRRLMIFLLCHCSRNLHLHRSGNRQRSRRSRRSRPKCQENNIQI